MDRLKGFASFVLITAVVLLGLRLVHVAVPAIFPETRQGPIDVASLGEVEDRVGFAPILPAYRPERLGPQPVSMRVWLSPRPTFAVVWASGDEYLSVTQRRGGPEPDAPPLSQPLEDVEDARWWIADGRFHLIVARDGFWIQIETTLPQRDLRRLADTLERY